MIHQRSLTQPRFLLLAGLTIAAVLTSQGSDATHFTDWAREYLGWAAHTTLGLWMMGTVTRLLSSTCVAALPAFVQILIGGLVGALCFAPVALILEAIQRELGWLNVDAPESLGQVSLAVVGEEFLDLVLPFCGSWLLLNLGYQSVQSPVLASATPRDPEAVAPEPTGLLARLPAAVAGPPLLIRSDLNYLEVVTEHGQAMVLYSLSRATEELGEQGIRVHRSYWVARSAVRAIRKSASGVQVELIDGSTAPVSRRRVREVRDLFGVGFRRRQ